jgi:hypothetical protein
MRAMRNRVRTCRPDYAVSSDENGIGLNLRDGSFLPAYLVAEDILTPIQLTIAQLEQRHRDEKQSKFR